MSSWNLPSTIRESFVNAADLRVHILEAGNPDHPLVILLHGFPELSYSWRKVLAPLAGAGYYVVAPDLRGFGQTTTIGRDPSDRIQYDEDLNPFRPLGMVKDVVALVHALRRDSVYAVVGHDFGSQLAGCCTLTRGNLFRRVATMSSPFTGAPSYKPTDGPKGTVRSPSIIPLVRAGLAALQPPRKHYTLYYSTPDANQDMHTAMGTTDDLHAFLRAYYHVKSADWEGNAPRRLAAPTPEAIEVLPEYYVMALDRTMPESVLPYAPPAAAVAQNRWLPDDELAVYVAEYARTGFQGGLNRYRCMTDEDGRWDDDLLAFAGKKVEVPAMFISGKKDWGVWQYPGAVEAMEATLALMQGRFALVEGAGHWVQQEQPGALVDLLLSFFNQTDERGAV
ncbi:putative epoxide hydrolase [Amylostereum chailletii]|nr:putative epoxide hydrolase [Amylostereum chailletii]